MTCSQTEKVSLLIDGELPPSQASEVKDHLQHCAECSDAHESFLKLRSQLTSYQSAIDSSAVNAALSKVLSRPASAKPTFAAPNWRDRLAAAFSPGRAFSTGFATAAALVVLAIAIGVIALLSRQQQPQVAFDSTNQKGPVAAAASPEQVSDAGNPQSQKAGNQSPPATPNNKGGIKPKPEQTPSRVPQPKRRRTETAPNYSAIENNVAQIQSLGPAEVELMTARHLEQSELLLRAFRNVRPAKAGQVPDIQYERARAQKLLYQNILVRREADAQGDIQVATLLGSLEPILLDIANLRAKPRNEDVVAIKERVERKSLVPLLQINSAVVARAYDE